MCSSADELKRKAATLRDTPLAAGIRFRTEGTADGAVPAALPLGVDARMRGFRYQRFRVRICHLDIYLFLQYPQSSTDSGAVIGFIARPRGHREVLDRCHATQRRSVEMSMSESLLMYNHALTRAPGGPPSCPDLPTSTLSHRYGNRTRDATLYLCALPNRASVRVLALGPARRLHADGTAPISYPNHRRSSSGGSNPSSCATIGVGRAPRQTPNLARLGRLQVRTEVPLRSAHPHRSNCMSLLGRASEQPARRSDREHGDPAASQRGAPSAEFGPHAAPGCPQL